MRRFLKRLALFAIAPVLFVSMTDAWLRQHETIYGAKLAQLRERADSVELLVLGNSHAVYGVDTTELGVPAHNLANLSQRIYFDKRLTLPLLDELPALEYVLISVDYHSLYHSSQGVRDIWSYYGHGIQHEDRDYLLCRLSPTLFGYTPKVAWTLMRRALGRSIRGDELTFDAEVGVSREIPMRCGFIAYQGTESGAFDLAVCQERADDFTRGVLASKELAEVVADLTDFIERLQARGIRPILFAAPTYAAFHACLDEGVVERNEAVIGRLTSTYGIPFWDHAGSPLFTQAEFYNCDHLNAEGARKFAGILKQQLLEYGESLGDR